jgi:hypothetical protein
MPPNSISFAHDLVRKWKIVYELQPKKWLGQAQVGTQELV